MAKRKKKHKEEPKGYGTELTGLVLILISVIGFGKFGIVGEIISNISILFLGNLWSILLILIFVVGLYMLIKREKLNSFSLKAVGLYMILIGVLILFHIEYLDRNNIEIAITLNDILDKFILTFKNQIVAEGGGLFGTLFTYAFIKLFSVVGAQIVSISFMVFGFIVMFNVSIIKFIKDLIEKIRMISFKQDFKKQGITINIDEPNDSEEIVNKKIITSLDELEEKPELKEIEERNIESANISNNSSYILPDFKTLLNKAPKSNVNQNKTVIKENVEKLEKVLSDFDIVGKVVEINVGPAVTQYEVELRSGTKVNKVLSIQREISLALAAKDVRIQAPIPGKGTIGIELPNAVNTMVSLREVIEDIPKSMDNSKLAVALGKNIMGKTMFMEINKTPHLLVAGATGSGKSVCINGIITTVLLRTRPSEVKIVLVDPKKVEMSMYNGVPHLLMPVVTDPRKASIALMKMVSEMERRYDLFEQSKTKNIEDYNKYIDSKGKSLSEDLERLPYILIIIDELSDLMLVAAKEVEDSILRITQMARAAGIHLIVATQRPSTEVITGIVKANIPSRISFAVSSNVDSRTILDMSGAEKLLGRGDMLFLPMGENSPVRIQGAFVSDQEINKVINYTVEQQKAKYDNRFDVEEKATALHDDSDEYEDPLYKEIVEFVVRNGKASASLLQRRFKLGYNRAARIMDLLEERGIVGSQNGSKPREVLVKLEDSEQ